MSSYPVVYPSPPNPTDFTAFLRTQAGIPVAALPDNSPYIDDALQIALDIVNKRLCQAVPDLYVLAVYNLGADRLVNFCPDQTPAITSLSWAASVVTAVLADPLPDNLPQGQVFNTIVSGALPIGYNAAVKATVLGSSSFSYPLATNPGTETTPGVYLLPFFASLRKSWNINAPVTGVISASSDNGTSNSIEVPEQLKSLTMSDLRRLKTPFGTAYIEIAQEYGQTLWDLT